MKLAPGTPLEIALLTDEASPPAPVGRLAMADRVAQLEWSGDVISGRRRIDPYLYPPEPGLHAARSRELPGLHGFLADSLPDAWGALLMKRRLAKIGVRIETLSAVDRLALVGREGRGALIYEPSTTPAEDVEAVDLDALSDQSFLILQGEESDLADTLARLGGASGGARPKLHLGFASDGSISVGHNAVAGDQEAWIVKFRAPGDPADIGPVEEAYARMASVAGITMATSRLLPARDGFGYFATRRFDRTTAGGRIHMVSLAGAIEAASEMPSLDYDGFLRTTMAITRQASDVEEAFRRMVFNVLAHNRDDHTRQHSYLFGPDDEWRLAPAYDLTFSHGPGGEHYMAVEGEGRTPSRAHVKALGKRHGLKESSIDAIVDQVRAAVAQWPALAAQTGVRQSARGIAAQLVVTAAVFG